MRLVTMFNVGQQIFRKLILMNKQLLPGRKKKRSFIVRSRFLQDISGKI